MEPHPDVLSRRSEAEGVLAALGGLLEETVNFGTHLFTWCLSEAPATPQRTVVALLLHGFVETLDGVSVLVRQACSEPAKIAMRSGLESAFGLLYILESDSGRRANCYRVGSIHRKITRLKSLDPSTSEGVR